MPVTERITAREYLAREDLEGLRTDLIDGEILVNSPGPAHQYARDRIHVALTIWTNAADGRGRVVSPLDVGIDEFNVFAPDLLWYAQERVPARADPRPYPAPDLAVEVRSPSTWRRDAGPKRRGYERVGVRELWLVDPAAEQVLTLRRSESEGPRFDVERILQGEAVDLSSPMLRGFRLRLGGLFAE